MTEQRVPITPAQAAHVAAKLAELQAAKTAFTYTFTLLTAGHVPPGSAFVSVETAAGILTVQVPDGASG